MFKNRYPGFGWKRAKHATSIVRTKETYAEVTGGSPIFVLDCEGCTTTEMKSELTRITMASRFKNSLSEVLVNLLR